MFLAEYVLLNINMFIWISAVQCILSSRVRLWLALDYTFLPLPSVDAASRFAVSILYSLMLQIIFDK